MKFMQISSLVIFSAGMSMNVVEGSGDLSVSGTTTTGGLVLNGGDLSYA